MKKIIHVYVAFNYWANNRICETIALLNDEQLNKEIPSSFSSIAKTLLHIWDAQDIWLERFNGRSPTSWPPVPFTGSKEELIAGVLKSSKALEEKGKSHGKKELKKKISYSTLKGIPGESAAYEMFAHVVNHSTYHRGQLITMLHQAGVTQLPSTDLVAFLREIKK